jgi:putative ABC transport system permease protein
LRHRPWQGVSLFLLAALIVTAASSTPLFIRSLEQSVTRMTLHDNAIVDTGIQLGWTGPQEHVAADRDPPIMPEKLAGYVPDAVRRSFAAQVLGLQAEPAATVDGAPYAGRVVWRTGMCAHVRMVTGRCPTDQDTIAVSEADSRRLRLHPGSTVSITDENPAPRRTPQVPLTVVGVYRQLPGPYWYGLALTGYSGQGVAGVAGVVQHDGWLTPESTLHSDTPHYPTTASNLFLLPREDLSVDTFRQLPAGIRAIQSRLDASADSGRIYLNTGIASLVSDVDHQQDQAEVTVPALMVQLGLLCLVVLWLVLTAVTDQRRPEIALALLRGQGRRRARRMLLGELVPIMVAATVAGGLAAVAVAWCAARWYLPHTPPVEPGRNFAIATAGSLLVLLAVSALAAVRVTREPVERLLRRVSPRAHGLRIGVGQAMLLAASAALVLVFVTGGLNRSASPLGPSFLALLVGIVLSILVPPVATAWSRRQLRRGRVASALAGLDAARSSATRRAVVLVTVATALLVFAVNADAVGARNREDAAVQYVGAARVLDLDSTEVPAIEQAVADVNAHGVRATTVLQQAWASTATSGTLGVVPDEFGRVVHGDTGLRTALKALAAPPAAPIRVQGSSLAVSVTRAQVRTTAPAHLVVLVTFPGRTPIAVDFGRLRSTDQARTIRRAVPCSSGCEIVGVGVTTNPGADDSGSFSLGPAGRWGRPGDWQGFANHSGRVIFGTAVDGSLSVTFATEGSDRVVGDHRWLPATLPALVTGARHRGDDGRHFTGPGVDGQDRAFRQVGDLARVPGVDSGTSIVNLDVAIRGKPYDQAQAVTVWLADDSPALLRVATAALAKRGVIVVDSTTIAHRRMYYEHSASGLTLGLGVGVGIVGLLIAVLVLLVLAISRWRTRSYDLAALRMAGTTAPALRRSSIAAELVAALLAVLVGTLVGIGGAALALRRLPFFTEPPAVSTLTLAPAWWACLGAALAAAVALGLTGWYIGRATARRARLGRLREAQ